MSHILVIKDYRGGDCIDSLYGIDNNFYYNDNNDIDNNNFTDIYQKLPSIFESLSTWPKSCNLRCINCGCTSKRIPLFIPISINGKIISVGSFICSPNCGLSEINSMKCTKEKKMEKILMFKMVIVAILEGLGFKTDCNKFEILPAPDKTLLSHFNGSISSKNYQEKIRELNDGKITMHLFTNT